jgi:hypothetical protein
VSPSEGERYYVLQRYFGIGAHEADCERADWEIANLLRQFYEKGGG